MVGIFEFALYKLTWMVELILIVKGCDEFCCDPVVILLFGLWHFNIIPLSSDHLYHIC
jgi:hypothetical protein